MYADFGKDKNTNDNDLLTHSISLQLYSKGGLFDFKMLTVDHIANNPLSWWRRQMETFSA